MSKRNNQTLYRANWVSINPEDVRVINSNERLNEKMEVWGQPNRNLDGYDNEDGESGFTSLNPEQVEGLFGDNDTVIKAESSDEDNDIFKNPEQANHEQVHHEQNMAGLSEELLRQAEEQVANARIEAERILVSAQTEADFMKRSAADEGRDTGYTEGLARAMGEIEAMKAELQEEKIKLIQEYEHLVDELEPQFIELVTKVYEQVFKVELKDLQTIVKHLVSNAMRDSDDTKSFIIRVSPEDYPYLDQNREELRIEAAVGQAQIDIIKDQTLASGDCLIETGGGVFDASFDTQLTGLNEKLRLLSYER